MLFFHCIFPFSHYFLYNKVLNKWTCFYPTKIDDSTFEFKVTSFGFFFLGRINIKTNNPLKPYQQVYSGLNYLVNCEDATCECNAHLTVIPSQKGFDKYQPNIDIDMGYIKCPICDEAINETIKAVKFKIQDLKNPLLNNSIFEKSRLKNKFEFERKALFSK